MSMRVDRRSFLYMASAGPLLAGPKEVPKYRIVTRADQSSKRGFPAPYPGVAIRVHSDDAVNAQANTINAQAVRAMLSAGMRALTGAKSDREAWAGFIKPSDIVGIKVNCSGAPEINSNPELVGAIINSLLDIGVSAPNIYIYDRFEHQMRIVNYKAHVPAGINTAAAETFPRLHSRLRPVHLRRGRLLWRRGYPVESHPAGF